MIYIIRHGQTELNKRNLLQGRSDHPLNEDGRKQAEALREYFQSEDIHFSHVYSSPLCRAIETAQIISGTDQIMIDERLIEMDYGPYEGSDLKNPTPKMIAFFSDFVNNPAPPGMEPLADIVDRSGRFIEEVHRQAAEGNVLISTHAIAMKGILEYLTPDSKGSYWSKFVGNCSVFAAEVTENGYTVPVEIFHGEVLHRE